MAESRFKLDLGTQRVLCDELVVGATGAVAVTFLPPFLMIARRNFARRVRVVMSRSAQQFITPFAVRTLSGQEPLTDLFNPTPGPVAPHIEITSGADLLAIFPATADILAKAAHGQADSPVSAAILAARCPVAFVPSMNAAMWENPAVQRNAAQLVVDGHRVMQPAEGYAVGDLEPSMGALPGFDAVFEFLAGSLQ